MSKATNLFEAMRPSVTKALNGFAATGDEPTDWITTPLSRSEFPVPELLLVLLRNVMGFESESVGEKVRWTVYFWGNGKPFAVELAKFGLRLYHERSDHASVQRVCGQLKQALGRLETRMKPLLDTQVAAGNITLQNRSHEFKARYQFFREKADAAFRAATRKPRQTKTGQKHGELPGSLTQLLEGFSGHLKARREGFYFSVAMVDAYFSYLEQRLVLLRAFQGAPMPSGGIKDIVAARWDDKFKAVLGSLDSTHGPLLGRLRAIKENVRNPFAHGGSQNDGGAIFCHVPGVGPIPGNLSRTKNSANFKWIPVDTDDHQTACKLFDDTDDVLCSGPLSKPSLLADGGLHPVWTKESMSEYRKLGRKSVKSINAYIERWNYFQDQHDNMDY